MNSDLNTCFSNVIFVAGTCFYLVTWLLNVCFIVGTWCEFVFAYFDLKLWFSNIGLSNETTFGTSYAELWFEIRLLRFGTMVFKHRFEKRNHIRNLVYRTSILDSVTMICNYNFQTTIWETKPHSEPRMLNFDVRFGYFDL